MYVFKYAQLEHFQTVCLLYAGIMITTRWRLLLSGHELYAQSLSILKGAQPGFSSHSVGKRKEVSQSEHK